MEDEFDVFNSYLNKLPFEDIQRRAEEQHEQDRKDFEGLRKDLKRGFCYYCKNPISHFSVQKPCYHWLLKPKGFKARYLPLLYRKRGFHEIQAYLKWVANTDEPFRNINNLFEEKSPNKILEETIRYKNLEWSFSLSPNCFKGLNHKSSKGEGIPHYHFQMKIDGRVVLDYGKHLPFNRYDDFCFAVESGKIDRIRYGAIYGAGMQELMNNFSAEEILDTMRIAPEKDTDNASLDVSTILIADEGTKISGETIAQLFEERRRTGVPIAKLVEKIKNVKATRIIAPGPGVGDISKRSPRKGR